MGVAVWKSDVYNIFMKLNKLLWQFYDCENILST